MSGIPASRNLFSDAISLLEWDTEPDRSSSSESTVTPPPPPGVK